ncbi:MAG: YHS domain-containing protein [Gemmatimonadetes bacterium]|nr:YHS domain-containing protein [Gemmatimonadota bacterium]
MPRILVIDDDPKVTSVVRRGLALEGYTVDVAGSGPDGLSIARDHTPDLVCGMTLNEKDAAATASFEGTEYYFCSQGCHAAFMADPKQYAGKQ